MEDSKNELLNNFYAGVSKQTRELCEKEKDHRRDPLESFESFCTRQEQASAENAKSCIDEWMQAFRIIIEELSSAHDSQAIQELLEGAEQYIKLPHEQKNEETTLKELFKYSQELVEKIYQVGRVNVERGHFAEASKVFALLITLDPGFSACWIMLGVALKMEKKWEESLEALDIAIQIDPHNPLPHLHAAGCFKELGHREKARQAYKKALDEILLQPKYAVLEKLVRLELSRL